jgi:hypothetical protein
MQGAHVTNQLRLSGRRAILEAWLMEVTRAARIL